MLRFFFFDRLLEKIRDRDPRIRSSRAMSDARASSSAMSLDAASELSRTDKRPPTYPPPPLRYFSSARSGRYPPHVQTHSPCADTRASRKLDNLRASSWASIEIRGWARYRGNRMTRRQFRKEGNAYFRPACSRTSPEQPFE